MTDIHIGLYPRKCNDPDILPYLDCCGDATVWYGGRSFTREMWDALHESNTYNEENSCYIFEKVEQLKPFIKACPLQMATGLSNGMEIMEEEDCVLIVWKR